MLVDAREMASESHVHADICIIGAGAAGITLAREFANTNLKVCLMESGGFDLDLATQNLYKGSSTGWPYWPLEGSRIRFFGGTTNHWGGNCIPLNEDDFLSREWVPNSGWPLSKRELMPYYESAQSLFGLGRYSYDPSDWETPSRRVMHFNGQSIVSKMFQNCRQKRFGSVYRDELVNSTNIHLYLYANAIDISANPAVNKVDSVRFACLNGGRFTVSATTYLLALGGIENSRILLASNKQQKNGLGNTNDVVGRYFSDHYYFSNTGLMVVPDPKTGLDLYDRKRRAKNQKIGVHFELSAKVRREDKLLSTRIHLSQVPWKAYSRDKGAPVVKRGYQDRIADKLTSLLGRIEQPSKLDKNSALSYGEPGRARLFSVGLWSEVLPRAESRIKLNESRDAFGMPRVTFDWKIGSTEKQSVMESLSYFARQVGANGIGRVRVDLDEASPWPWVGGGEPGLHQMGGTRMSDNPGKGVVDKNCRVHGLTNLYVAGSSVFPTFGTANPTLTIVALALRLAKHIKSKMHE